MSENIFDISAAIVKDLNDAPAGTFSESFTAEMKIVPKYEIEDLKTLRVTVVPRVLDLTNITRTMLQHDFTIDIGIQKKMSSSDQNAEAIALYPVVTEIIGYLKKRKLTGVAWASQQTVTNNPVVSVTHLDENRVFTSMISIGYTAVEE